MNNFLFICSKKLCRSDLEPQSNSTNQRSPFLDFIHQGVLSQGDSQGVTEWSKDGDIAGGTKIFPDGIQILVLLQFEADNNLVIRQSVVLVNSNPFNKCNLIDYTYMCHEYLISESSLTCSTS